MKSLPAALVLVITFTLTACNWNPFHRMYSATAEVQIKPDAVAVAFLKPIYADPSAYVLQLKSSNMLVPVIQNLNLAQIWAKRYHSDHEALSPQEALDHLNKVLKIEAMRGTNIVKVTASSEVPQEAADIANAVIDTYKATRDQEEIDRAKQGMHSLREEIAEQQKVVREKEAALQKTLQNWSSTNNGQDNGISALRTDCAKIEANIEDLLKAGSEEDSPSIISQRKELAIKRKQLETSFAELLSKQDADSSMRKSVNLQNRDYEVQQSLLDALNIHLKQNIVEAQFQESPVRIVSRAVAPPE